MDNDTPNFAGIESNTDNIIGSRKATQITFSFSALSFWIVFCMFFSLYLVSAAVHASLVVVAVCIVRRYIAMYRIAFMSVVFVI